tara:strand:- start:7188 stop:8321 length:1134 start_codon:yes stop_codon:yes gene_type:complete
VLNPLEFCPVGKWSGDQLVTNGSGVGAELLEIIPHWLKPEGCNCEPYAAMLDKKGIEWCEQHRELIIVHLVSQAKTLFIGRISESVDRALASRWLEKAIKQAKAKQTTPVTFPISTAAPKTISQVTLATMHYNACGYRRMRETYYEWLPTLGPLARSLVCYELVFDDDRPEIEGSRVIRGTREANAMWQKEPLLNVALAKCKTPYFCWVDHDMVFLDPNWLTKAIAAITDETPAVQLFSRIDYLHQDRTYHHSVPSCTSLGRYRSKCNPGGMWIAKTAWLKSVGGLPTEMIVGAGDCEFLRRHRARCTSIEGTVFHLWHGSQSNRQHNTRADILKRHNFDFGRDVRSNDDGILEWSSEKPKLHAEVRGYFQNRREDG